MERDQRYGAPPAPAYRQPPGAIDVRKSVAGSKGSYKIKDGDCLYRIAVNHGTVEVKENIKLHVCVRRLIRGRKEMGLVSCMCTWKSFLRVCTHRRISCPRAALTFKTIIAP